MGGLSARLVPIDIGGPSTRLVSVGVYAFGCPAQGDTPNRGASDSEDQEFRKKIQTLRAGFFTTEHTACPDEVSFTKAEGHREENEMVDVTHALFRSLRPQR